MRAPEYRSTTRPHWTTTTRLDPCRPDARFAAVADFLRGDPSRSSVRNVKLAGRTVLITGASQGLGAETARAIAARGAEVLLLARSEDKLRDVAASIERSGGRAHVHPVDLADLAAVTATTAAIKTAGITPDVLINNAGIGRWLFIEETPLEEMQAIMAVPYFAAFAVTQAFIAEMAERGSGNICNVNSPAAWFPWPGSVAYAAARWALRGFSAALRADVRGTGLTVTDVVLSKIASSYWQNNPGSEERAPWVDRLIPTLSPERAAAIVTRAVERERREAPGRSCTRSSTRLDGRSRVSCTGVPASGAPSARLGSSSGRHERVSPLPVARRSQRTTSRRPTCWAGVLRCDEDGRAGRPRRRAGDEGGIGDPHGTSSMRSR
jgi:short-subunit dehydrogenase